MSPDYRPVRFIDVEVDVGFDRSPALLKKPGAPNTIFWGQTRLRVEEVISEWFDTSRRGDMARNMQDAHLRVAEKRGSWGVGRFFFRVRTQDDRFFDLYFDRAPKGAGDRKGHWFLWRELERRDPE